MKKTLLGILVGLVVSVLIFMILYKIKVINFKDVSNDKNGRQKENVSNDESIKLCSKNVSIDGETYYIKTYKMDEETKRLVVSTSNNEIIIEKSYGLGHEIYGITEENCLNNVELTRQLITSDEKYNYYAYKLYAGNINYWYLISENNGVFKNLTDFNAYNFGVVTLDKTSNYTDDDLIPTVSIQNNKVYELKQVDAASKIVEEYIYFFQNGEFFKTKTENSYICVAMCL